MEASVQFLSSPSEVGFLTSISQMRKQKPREAKALAQGQVRGSTPAGTLERPCSSLGILPPCCRPLFWGPDLVAKPQRLEAVRAALTMCERRCFWVTSCVLLEVEALRGPPWVTQASRVDHPQVARSTAIAGLCLPRSQLLAQVCAEAPTHQGAPVSSDHPPRTKAEGAKGQQIKTIEVTSLVLL